MRVTPGAMTAQLVRDLGRALSALATQQARLSAGRRVLAPADDPGGAARAVTIRSRQAANAQFRENLAAARTSLASGEAALSAAAEVLTQAKEVAVQAVNATNDAPARRSLAVKVDQLLETLVELANHRGTGGVFAFAGQEVTSPPYTATRDASGRIVAVTPNPRGVDTLASASVGPGMSVPLGATGSAVFGPPTDPTYAFDVLIRLRDNLEGTRRLTFVPDVGASGDPLASRYRGIDDAADLVVAGPAGQAAVGLTVAGDDPLSFSGPATSARATAARINLVTPLTGVTATVTPARITYTRGSFAADLTLDGTPGRRLVLNGVSLAGAVSGATPGERRDALVALVNGASGATGVTATAVPLTDDFTLTAADGRNISLETDADVGPSSANALVFGFATGLTATGPATQVVARGGVTLTADGRIDTTVAPGPALADQVGGEGLSGLEAAIDELDVVAERSVLAAVGLGASLGWLNLLEERLAEQSVEQAGTLSGIEDLDMARAITEFQHLEGAYEAALGGAARLVRLSLLDFLR